MTHFALQPAARRGDSVDTILGYGPAAAALAYPLVLMLLHRCGQQLAEANTATAILCAGLGAGTAAALIVCVPLLSFVAIRLSDQLQTRRLAHRVFAAPPLFTVTGPFLPRSPTVTTPFGVLGRRACLCGKENGRPGPRPRDQSAGSDPHMASPPASSPCAFVIWGISPITSWPLESVRTKPSWMCFGLVSFQHRAALPHALLLWQLPAGCLLAKLPSAGDLYSSIQTATAAYLAVYVSSHLIAVFVLGRWFLAVDTTFPWASGAPTGLLLDPWSVRLIPHYSLAVLFLFSHLAVGLRAVLLGHGIRAITAARTTWTICAAGLAVALVIMVAQLRVGT